MYELDISVVAKLFVQTESHITGQSIQKAMDRIAGNSERGLITYLQGNDPIVAPEEAARQFAAWVRKVMAAEGKRL